MTDRDVTKPYVLIRNQSGRAARRWYPHEVLERLAGRADLGEGVLDNRWDLLERADAASWLPELRLAQRNLDRFISMIEGIATGTPAKECESCSQRFYPSRSDARFCKSACRMAAHRGRNG